MKKLLLIFSALLLLSSCFKEEEKRPQYEGGTTIEMGSDYLNQVFYNIANNEIVSTNSFETWYLGFYAQDDDFYIKLNSARYMFAYETGSTDFENITALDNSWLPKSDYQTGDRNQLALDVSFNTTINDSLFSDGEVYVLDLGTNEQGVLYGFKKIVFEKVWGDNYYIRFANLDNTDEQTAIISKDPTLNFVAFSFDNGGETVTVEPDRNTWDIVFTSFTAQIDTLDQIIPYAVTGAYFNPYFMQGYQTSGEFTDVDFNSIDVNKLSTDIDIVGHDWKIFSLDDNQYFIYDQRNYILRTQDETYFKMRFLDFYNPDSGEKGYPTFEIFPL